MPKSKKIIPTEQPIKKISCFLLYRMSSVATGGFLAEHMMNIPEITMDHGFEPPDSVDIMIRWGSTKSFVGRCHHVINKKKSIELARDKFQSLIVLKKAGIEVPKISKDASDLKFPILAREIRHQEGKDLFLCLQNNDIIKAKKNGAEYFVQYIPTKKEFRIHVINSKIIKVFEKIPTYDDKMITFVRNNTFSNFKLSEFDEANKLAIKAVTTLGMDFGAVDVIMGDDNELYCLEINSAPRLNLNTLELYVTELTTLIHESHNSQI